LICTIQQQIIIDIELTGILPMTKKEFLWMSPEELRIMFLLTAAIFLAGT